MISIQIVSNIETIKKILDCREIGPTLLSLDIGDICDPLLVRATGCEISIENIGIEMEALVSIQFPLEFSLPSDRTYSHLVH